MSDMDELNRRVLMQRLLDLYRALLSERTAAAMDMYLGEDLGYSEIAQQTGISRQGAYDAVRKGEAQLMQLESQLGMLARLDEIAALSIEAQRALERGEPDKARSAVERISGLTRPE